MSAFIRTIPDRTAYLAGAGISVPAPAYLPTAPALISEITTAVTDDANFRTAIMDRTFGGRATLDGNAALLRFETILTCIHHAVDPTLDLLSIFSECRTPTPYHYFLADQLRRGAILLTTNFDNLIEIACHELSVAYTLIVHDEELAAFAKDPLSVKCPLVKLHGAYNSVAPSLSSTSGPVNIKTTLPELSIGYLRKDSDSISPVLACVMAQRHLVVLGYSGCDDFDIVPSIRGAKPCHGLTWIDHVDGRPTVFRPDSDPAVRRPPYEIMATHNVTETITSVVCGPTAEILGVELPEVSGVDHDWHERFLKWAASHLGSDASRRLSLGLILIELERYQDAIEILDSIPRETITDSQAELKALVLSCTYLYINDPDRAILFLGELIDSDGQVGDLSVKGFAYYNLSRINTDAGRYVEAMSFLDAAFQIFEKNQDWGRVSDCLYEHGRINESLGELEVALQHTNFAISISERIGDLAGVGHGHLQIGRALSSVGKLDEAETHIRRGLEVFSLQGSSTAKGIAHHALGVLLFKRERLKAASQEFETAIAYERRADSQLHLAHSLHCLADVMMSVGDLAKAREYINESLAIKLVLKDQQGIENSELLLASLELLAQQSRLV